MDDFDDWRRRRYEKGHPRKMEKNGGTMTSITFKQDANYSKDVFFLYR